VFVSIALQEIEREIAFDHRKSICGISRLLSASTVENLVDIAVGGVRVAVSQEIRFFSGSLLISPYSWQHQ
jgi:hypothetical protein